MVLSAGLGARSLTVVCVEAIWMWEVIAGLHAASLYELVHLHTSANSNYTIVRPNKSLRISLALSWLSGAFAKYRATSPAQQKVLR